MASHELAATIGIIAIWTTLGAFFAGYYIAKRKSKKHFKPDEKTAENQSYKTQDDSKPTTKKFDWI